MGCLSALYVLLYARANPDFVSDFDQVWAGAERLWHGQNPYTAVGLDAHSTGIGHSTTRCQRWC
jgi:hypothetical protein